MKFFRGIIFSLILLAPVVFFGWYAYQFGQSCPEIGAGDFPCRILVWASYISFGLDVLFGVFLGFCVGYRLYGLRRLTSFYFFCLLAVPAVYGAYLVAPADIRDQIFEGKDEKYCMTLSGLERDKCLLDVYRNRLGSATTDVAWCDNIQTAAIRLRCQADVKAVRGDATLCTKVNGQYPMITYNASTTKEEVAMQERERCYRTATFALHNMSINSKEGDLRYSLNADLCSDEPRSIAQNYCYLRIGECSHIGDKVIAADCALYKKLFLK